MNAAARLLNQGTLSRGWVVTLLLTRTQVLMCVLTVAVLTSALSIVYVTNATRSLHANIQQALVERNHLHVQWGQLLLEKSTHVMQARVQTIAEQKLNMMVPDHKSVVIVNN